MVLLMLGCNTTNLLSTPTAVLLCRSTSGMHALQQEDCGREEW